MSLLRVASYGAMVVAILFLTLSLASGLLWIASVIEEHSRTAKTVGKRTVYAVIAFHVLLYIFDDNDLPMAHIGFSICCHFVYLLNFANFPLINLTSLSFIASCLMAVADHFLWFFHFHNALEKARRRQGRWSYPLIPDPHTPTFRDISTFFGICVWLVPLFLFLSLSANDNALPTVTQHDPAVAAALNYDKTHLAPDKPQRSSLFTTLYAKAMSIFPSSRLLRKLSGNPSDDSLMVPQYATQTTNPLHLDPTLMSPASQRRATSPQPSTVLMSPPMKYPAPSSSQGLTPPMDGGALRGDGNISKRVHIRRS